MTPQPQNSAMLFLCMSWEPESNWISPTFPSYLKVSEDLGEYIMQPAVILYVIGAEIEENHLGYGLEMTPDCFFLSALHIT